MPSKASKKRRPQSAAQSRLRPAAGRAADTPRVSRETLILVGILFAAAAVYLGSLGNDFVFDDHEMIIANRYIGEWSFFWKSFVNDSWWFRDPYHLPQSSYYRPLQDVWLALHFHLFGLNPMGWHGTMVALHVLVVFIVYKAAAHLSDSPTGLLAAGLFAVMPIHCEAVVWPTAIPLPLSAAFELGALYLFMTRSVAAQPRLRWALAMSLYAGALLSHEGAVIFPALVALYVFLLESDRTGESEAAPAGVRHRGRRAAVLVAPFAAEAMLYLLARLMVLGFISRPNRLNPATRAQNLMTLPLAALNYLTLLVMPWMAGPSHRLLLVSSPASRDFWLPLIVLVTLAAAFILPVARDRHRRLYLFCAGWIVVAIAPVMNLRGLFYQGLIQDRYLYLASFAWCVMLADCALRVVRRRGPEQQLAWGAVGVLAIVYTGSLWHVQRFWHDDVALFTQCIRNFPESGLWHSRLALALEERGDLAGAERQFVECLRIDPKDGGSLFDLGGLHARLGRRAEAIKEVAAGLSLMSHPPAGAYIMLAGLYDLTGDEAGAEAALKSAEAQPGGVIEAGLFRAKSRLSRHDFAGAERLARDLTRRFPDNAMSWNTLGAALGSEGRDDEALKAFERATELAPGDWTNHFYAALVLHRMGRDREALQQCRLAINGAPEDSRPRSLMATIASEMARQGAGSR